MINREKELRKIHEVVKEEKLAATNVNLEYIKKLIDNQLVADAPPQDSQNEQLVSSDDYKSLICPSCLNFIYKCQTTVCGHNFCTRCIDEYLIIKKTCFICDKTIRNAKGTVLQPCFSIDDVITQLIQKCEEPDVKVSCETQKCEFNKW